MTRCLSGRKTFIHNVEKLAVVSVLEALVQRVSKDPAYGKHHNPDQNQRNWQKKENIDSRGEFKALCEANAEEEEYFQTYTVRL